MQGFEQDNSAVLKRGQEAEGWYLEGIAGKGKTWFIHLQPLPFTIGRQEGCHLCLSSPEVSRRHAEIYERDGELRIRECGSTNGTFINRKRLDDDAPLRNGDVLHFGSLEFRISHKQAATRMNGEKTDSDGTMSMSIKTKELPHGFLNCAAEFNEMLHRGAVIPYFQPIIRLSDLQTVGYELLGRGDYPGLSSNPDQLIHIAKTLGKEVQLSDAVSSGRGVQRARGLKKVVIH